MLKLGGMGAWGLRQAPRCRHHPGLTGWRGFIVLTTFIPNPRQCVCLLSSLYRMTSSMPSHAGSIGGLSAVQRNFARQEKEYEIEAHPPASGVLYFRPWTNNMLTFSFWTFWDLRSIHFALTHLSLVQILDYHNHLKRPLLSEFSFRRLIKYSIASNTQY